MHDLERDAAFIARRVGGVQTVENIGDDARGDLERHHPLGLPDVAQELGERGALDVLHDDEELVLVEDDVDGVDHVRMPDAERDTRLVEKHRRDVAVGPELGVETLHGDGPPEPAVATQASDVDRRQATAGELGSELVSPDEDRLALEQAGGASVLLVAHRGSQSTIEAQI